LLSTKVPSSPIVPRSHARLRERCYPPSGTDATLPLICDFWYFLAKRTKEGWSRVTNGMNVRETAESDLGRLAKLMTGLGYPTSVEEMNRRLEEISADPSYCTLVAESDGQVLAMAGPHRARLSVRNILRRLPEAVGNGNLCAAILLLGDGDLFHEELHKLAPLAPALLGVDLHFCEALS
jgi:hypothetical protein